MGRWFTPQKPACEWPGQAGREQGRGLETGNAHLYFHRQDQLRRGRGLSPGCPVSGSVFCGERWRGGNRVIPKWICGEANGVPGLPATYTRKEGPSLLSPSSLCLPHPPLWRQHDFNQMAALGQVGAASRVLPDPTILSSSPSPLLSRGQRAPSI